MSKSYGSFSSNSSIDCLLKKSFDMKYTCTSIKLNKKKYQCSKNYHKWKDIRNVLKHLQLKIFAHCMICKIFFFSRKVLLCHQYNVYYSNGIFFSYRNTTLKRVKSLNRGSLPPQFLVHHEQTETFYYKGRHLYTYKYTHTQTLKKKIPRILHEHLNFFFMD